MGATLSWLHNTQPQQPHLTNYKKTFFNYIRSPLSNESELVEFIMRHRYNMNTKIIVKGMFKSIHFDNISAFYILLNFYRSILTETNERKILLLFAKKDALFMAPKSMLFNHVVTTDKTFYNRLADHSTVRSLTYLILFVSQHQK